MAKKGVKAMPKGKKRKQRAEILKEARAEKQRKTNANVSTDQQSRNTILPTDRRESTYKRFVVFTGSRQDEIQAPEAPFRCVFSMRRLGHNGDLARSIGAGGNEN